MRKTYLKIVRLVTFLFLIVSPLSMEMSLADTGSISKSDAGWMIDTVPYSISPPEQDGPIKIKIDVRLLEINNISDHEQLIDFMAEMKLSWTDERNAFDPKVAGVDEKTYTGNFQFDELSTSWYPQVVLLNEKEVNEFGASIVKVKPDGFTTLIKEVSTSARTPMDLRPYPFDSQKILITFAIFGYATDRMVFETDTFLTELSKSDLTVPDLTVPEWTLTNLQSFIGEMKAPLLGRDKTTSTFTLEVDVKRKSVFVTRTIIIPVILIVLLGFSVFWLALKSIQDRLNVSFIGILTITAYQLVIGDLLPHVSYFTLVHELLNISLIMVCLTVAINIFMGYPDKKSSTAVNLNYICRWAFPILYISSVFMLYVFKEY